MAGWHHWGFVGVSVAAGGGGRHVPTSCLPGIKDRFHFVWWKNADFYTLSLLLRALGITVFKMGFNPLSLLLYSCQKSA